jgi:diguanylate cyclase (GGDEF)-like protein
MKRTTANLVALQELARLAAPQGLTTIEPVQRAAEMVSQAMGASAARLIYAEDNEFVTTGDPWPEPDGELSQIALWLVQQQLVNTGAPVAFRVKKHRVVDFVPALEARGRPYLAFLLPGHMGFSEFLVVHGSWRRGKALAAFEFVQAATPALTVLLDRLLDANRTKRQRRQLSALADLGHALVQSHDLEAALRDMATALAGLSGFEIVNVYLWDPNQKRCTLVAISESRYSSSALDQEWRRLAVKHYNLLAGKALETGAPQLSLEPRNDERLPDDLRSFFARALFRSSAMFPLVFKDETLGSVAFASFKPHSFPPEDLEFLRGLAAQVAMALKGLHLYHDLAESREELRQYAERLQASMEIQHSLARTDPLTGIPNRRYLDEIVNAESARAVRQNSILSLAMADLDYFKLVNDTYGHPAGDEVLIAVSQLARRTCREMDVVGRYGGDEFVFVLPGADLEAAGAFAERFRNRVSEVCFRPCADAEIRLTVSLGTSGTNGTPLDRPTELLERADRALYQAKSDGRNRTCLYLPDGSLASAA